MNNMILLYFIIQNGAMPHWGALITPPGCTDPRLYAAGGNPYSVSASAPQDQTEVPASVLDAMRVMAERVVTVAGWLLKGREV